MRFLPICFIIKYVIFKSKKLILGFEFGFHGNHVPCNSYSGKIPTVVLCIIPLSGAKDEVHFSVWK